MGGYRKQYRAVFLWFLRLLLPRPPLSVTKIFVGTRSHLHVLLETASFQVPDLPHKRAGFFRRL